MGPLQNGGGPEPPPRGLRSLVARPASHPSLAGGHAAMVQVCGEKLEERYFGRLDGLDG